MKRCVNLSAFNFSSSCGALSVGTTSVLHVCRHGQRERKQTDVESDEEFEEMTSDDLFTFYFGDKVEDVYDALTLQLSKKRLDRVEKILEILAADQSRTYSLQNALDAILWDAFKLMPIGDCSELLQIIFAIAETLFDTPSLI